MNVECLAGVSSRPNNSMQPTGNSVAFMRETCARRVMTGRLIAPLIELVWS